MLDFSESDARVTFPTSDFNYEARRQCVDERCHHALVMPLVLTCVCVRVCVCA
jgi:hypothetical protein